MSRNGLVPAPAGNDRAVTHCKIGSIRAAGSSDVHGSRSFAADAASSVLEWTPSLR
jgi:hypothetical protein